MVYGITTTQLYSTKLELIFCADLNPSRAVSEIRDGEDLWQWSWLEIRLNAFCWSTIPQKQFIIIIISETLSPASSATSSASSGPAVDELFCRPLCINECTNQCNDRCNSIAVSSTSLTAVLILTSYGPSAAASNESFSLLLCAFSRDF